MEAFFFLVGKLHLFIEMELNFIHWVFTHSDAAASAVFNYYFSDDAAGFEDLKDDVDIALLFNDAIRKRHQYWTAQSKFGRKN